MITSEASGSWHELEIPVELGEHVGGDLLLRHPREIVTAAAIAEEGIGFESLVTLSGLQGRKSQRDA